MSDLAKLIALVQLHGLEGWTLADTQRLKELAEQHAAQLRECADTFHENYFSTPPSCVEAAADFLCAPRRSQRGSRWRN